MSPALYEAATLVLPMIFAIVLHEIAHGQVARLLGDPTARDMGRLSLNPFRHVDLFGTLILPGALRLAGLPVFGWAKPVPVDYRRLNNPKRDMAFVGAAGPLMNIALATLTAVAMGLIARAYPGDARPSPAMGFVLDNCENFLGINIFLALFNLLPLPPFDGSRILRGIAPWPVARLLDRIEPFGIVVFFALFVILPQVFPSLHLIDRVLGPPFAWAASAFGHLALLVAGGHVP